MLASHATHIIVLLMLPFQKENSPFDNFQGTVTELCMFIGTAKSLSIPYNCSPVMQSQMMIQIMHQNAHG